MLLLNTLLSLAWVAITGELTFLNLMAGFAIGYIVLWVVWRARGPSDYFSRVTEAARCAGIFLWELWSATLRVSLDILSPSPDLRPAIMAIPIDPLTTEDPDSEPGRTELEPSSKRPTAAEITTLANLITLTPGTLCLDVSPDGRTLFVHTMHADDMQETKHTIQNGLGKSVRRIFQ